MNREERIKEIVEKFGRFNSWEDRYKEIIEMGKSLEAMPLDEKTEANKVKGCQSQVWLSAEMKNNLLYFHGDSDASIVKGIVAILLSVYSKLTPDEILTLKPTFLDEIGLRQHLSMSRANGLNSMLKQIQFYAMAFKAKAQMELNKV